MRSLSLLMATALVGGCSFQANVSPTSVPASEILPQKVGNYPVSMYLDPGLSGLTREASLGYVCSANSFPVNVGPAINSSLHTVNELAFRQLIPGGGPSTPAPGAVRHLVYEPESFIARLDFASQFFTARAISNSELVIRIRALDQEGKEVLRTMVSGNGYGETSGVDCSSGAKALEIATSEAVRRAVDNYVFKVINAEQLRVSDGEIPAVSEGQDTNQLGATDPGRL